MRLSALTVARFRNLAPQRLTIPAGLVLLVGPNGSGKTSLLESVAVLGNLTSFRTTTTTALPQHGTAGFRLEGVVHPDGGTVELAQEVSLTPRATRRLHLGGRAVTPGEYAAVFPVVTLCSLDREFLVGGPEQRRRFLDRLAFFRHPDALNVLQRYRRALRQRNALLARDAPDREVEPFEAELARDGARIMQLRLDALVALEPVLEAELAALGWSLPRPNLRYDCPDRLAPADPATMAQRLRAALLRSRRLERVRGHSLVGPHRHDLAVSTQGAHAREVLSAGQTKLLVTALKLAAAALFSSSRGFRPVMVVDDVDAELDAEVLARVLARLGDGRQALLSSPHEERVLPRAVPTTRWRLAAGTVTPG